MNKIRKANELNTFSELRQLIKPQNNDEHAALSYDFEKGTVFLVAEDCSFTIHK